MYTVAIGDIFPYYRIGYDKAPTIKDCVYKSLAIKVPKIEKYREELLKNTPDLEGTDEIQEGLPLVDNDLLLSDSDIGSVKILEKTSDNIIVLQTEVEKDDLNDWYKINKILYGIPGEIQLGNNYIILVRPALYDELIKTAGDIVLYTLDEKQIKDAIEGLYMYYLAINKLVHDGANYQRYQALLRSIDSAGLASAARIRGIPGLNFKAVMFSEVAPSIYPFRYIIGKETKELEWKILIAVLRVLAKEKNIFKIIEKIQNIDLKERAETLIQS